MTTVYISRNSRSQVPIPLFGNPFSRFLLFYTILELSFASANNGLRQRPDGGPWPRTPYPISAAWFKDRYTDHEWHDTLRAFTSIGGNTVWLRAPPIVFRSKQDILNDPDFTWCGSETSPTGVDGPDCVTEAETDMKQKGVTIVAFATYKYDEDYSEKMVKCPGADVKIMSSRVYHRAVLNLAVNRRTCDFQAGDRIVIIFTVFNGIDPHYLLVRAAASWNVSVYFGLPPAPSSLDLTSVEMQAYYLFTFRIVFEHQYRYQYLYPNGSRLIKQVSSGNLRYLPNDRLQHRSQNGGSKGQTLYDVISGYYLTSETSLVELANTATPYYDIFATLADYTRTYGKKFVISPYILLNKSQGRYTVEQHVAGFEALGLSGSVDVVAVQEGRGCAKGCYYWPDQIYLPIVIVDPVLVNIVRYLQPAAPLGVTYWQTFSGSNNELFPKLATVHDNIILHGGKNFDFWLNVEAFEYLRYDPCLPIDPSGSGMAEILNRASKSRLDWALTVAGAQVQKIISFAWDSDFVCTTRDSKGDTLLLEITRDYQRPIVANCSWHSPENMSIVVLGFNLAGLQQTFQIEYSLQNRTRLTESVFGYYYEIDYGLRHDRVPSLQYVQLFDLDEISHVAAHGSVTVMAVGSYHECVFQY